jgi:Ca-activated chloride channel family protein
MNQRKSKSKYKLYAFLFILAVIILRFCGDDEKNKQEDVAFEENIDNATDLDIDSLAFEFTEDMDFEPVLARNYYFIFDGSGSMDNSFDGKRKIDGAKQAVWQFIKKVPLTVNLGLYIFDSRGSREVVALGEKKHKDFIEAIRDVRAGGGTPLAEAIKYASDALIKQRKKQLGYGEYNIIVVTDGIANHIPEAGDYAVNANIAIHAIGLGIEANHPLNDSKYVISYTAADDYTKLTQALIEAVAESPVFDSADFN